MWLTSTPDTSEGEAPIDPRPETSASHDESAAQPVSSSTRPPPAANAYEDTYRRGLSGIGTGMDHRSPASCSTGGMTRSRQAASCLVPVTSCPAGIAVMPSLLR